MECAHHKGTGERIRTLELPRCGLGLAPITVRCGCSNISQKLPQNPFSHLQKGGDDTQVSVVGLTMILVNWIALSRYPNNNKLILDIKNNYSNTQGFIGTQKRRGKEKRDKRKETR